MVHPGLPDTPGENCKSIFGSFPCRLTKVGSDLGGGGAGKPLLLLEGYFALGPYPTLTPTSASWLWEGPS